MFQQIITFIVDTVSSLGYPGIFALMFLESSFFPFPSEVVMIPAGYLVNAGEMNMFMVIFCGIAGSLAGALFNYYLGYKLGRPFFLKYGKYILFNEDKFLQVEGMFLRHGEIITFIARLIPGVRQYMSFPAGITKMGLIRFCLFTSAGAGIWVTILTLLGYIVGQNQELLKIYLNQIVYTLLILSVILIAIYVYWHQRKKNRSLEAEEA